ncbi:YdgA family protein [Thauera sp. Sel9]|uniref:YdgA family protein n=1 Tax=Thauera sp. Sel9 TaxID=2974299 RepID=UPI0021E15922|nr:YdgA family protein [Thauera sp. Sel9]MCV2217137.1 YdgA family protein [Thauera sp. Sel9]
MNRPTKIAAALAVIALSYPAAAWFAGQKIQTILDEQYAEMQSHPTLKIAERSYERGLFSSTEKVSFEMAMPLVAEDGTLQAGEPFRMHAINRIEHGPLPGLSTLAAATMDTELVIDGEQGERLAAALNGRAPLTARTVFQFDGSGRSAVDSPALEFGMPDGTGNELRISLGGLKADVAFSAGLRSYTTKGTAESMSMEDPNMRITLSGLSFDGDQRRLFDDEPWLHVGRQRATVASMDVSGKEDSELDGMAFQLERMSYDIDAPAEGDYVDVKALIGTEVLRIGDADYGPAHYDFSLTHLHGRTLVELWRKLVEIGSDPTALAAQAEDPTAIFAPLAEPAMALLGHNPAFSIDRISFTSPHGKTDLSAQVRLDGLQPEELANPMMLIARLQAAADLSVPQALLLAFGTSQAENEDEAAFAAAQLDAQLGALEAQGYLQRNGGIVKTQAAFRQGQLTVNGKPFNPLALGGH